MHSNAWNLKSNKERLSIIERTQAQKKHLLNILTAKSKLDTHNNTLKIKHCPTTPNLFQKKIIDQNNQSMIQRIIKISQLKHSPSRSTNQLTEVVRNLKTYSSLNRSIRMKEIEEENSKIFSRLIMTSPTIKRQQWIKRNIQTSKYKENLHRGKYLKPDYSLQACKIMAATPKFRYINWNSSDRKVGELKHSKLF